jgi:hypothetical protein
MVKKLKVKQEGTASERDRARHDLLDWLYHRFNDARSRKSQGATSGEIKKALKEKDYKENQSMQALKFLIDRDWVREEKETREVTLARGRVNVEKIRYRITDTGVEHFEGASRFESADRGAVVNIQGSTVAALNLGSVIGNIEGVVITLRDSGNEELAHGLKELIERVAVAEELGDQRREVIESLTTIGEQAILQPDERRPGVVKSLLGSVGMAIGHAANISEIWQVLAPVIARQFGLPWP